MLRRIDRLHRISEPGPAAPVEENHRPEVEYQLRPTETLADGVRRILDEQISLAIFHLRNRGENVDAAVHESRKCLKRTRSLLRLVRPSIPKQAARENRRLQIPGRTLSELRDAQALIGTLEDLKKRLDGRAAGAAGIEELLRKRKEHIAREMDSNGTFEKVLENLADARASISQLPLDGLTFAIIAESFAAGVRSGRKAFQQAESDRSADNFHECRKRVKDFRYQLSVLAPMWADVLEGYSDAAKELEEYLGDDHNLAVLADLIKQQKDRPKHESRDVVHAIRATQHKLRGKAQKSAARLYAEPPKAWATRLDLSWKMWSETA